MSLTANSFRGLGLNSALTGTLSALQTSRIKPEINFDNFANFVFFNSAERKVQTALTFILDNWPVGRTDGFFGSTDFQLNDSVDTSINDFNAKATDYELYLLGKLGDPGGIGHATVTSTLTANTNLSTSATRIVINLPRDIDLLLTESTQSTFVSNLLDDAKEYDLGFNRVAKAGGTASIDGVGTEFLPTVTSESVNREHRLFNLLPTFFFENDDKNVLDRFLSAIAEVADDLKVRIDQFANLRTIDYNFPKAPRGNAQTLLAELLGFKLVNENLRQDFTKQLIRSGLSGDTSINAVIEELHERVLNNLLHIYKAKGTKESLEALIKSYGFPKEYLQVKEYVTQPKTKLLRETKRKNIFTLDYSANTNKADRLIAHISKPNNFDFVSNEVVVEARIKNNTTLSSSQTATFLSLTNSSDEVRLKLFLTDQQLGCSLENKTQLPGTSTLESVVTTNASSSAQLNKALSSGFVNVSVCADLDNIVLNAFYFDIINGTNTLTSISASITNSVSAATSRDVTVFNFKGGLNANSVVSFGGDVDSFDNEIEADNVINIYQGLMHEVRIWDTTLDRRDLSAHALNFENIGKDFTDAVDKPHLTASLVSLSDPYTNLKYHYKLRDNLKQGQTGSGTNSTKTVTGDALRVIGATASTDLYSQQQSELQVFTINNAGLVSTTDRVSVSGINDLSDVKDARAISLVTDPIQTINENILNTYSQLDTGDLFGTATSLYENLEYDSASPFIQNWYKNWPDEDNINTSLMFRGLREYQSAVENLQDILFSLLETSEQLTPAHSHTFEKGLIIAPHLLNRSRQKRIRDSITGVDVLGNISTAANSITAAEDGLLESGTFNNINPQYYNTQLVDYSLQTAQVTGLSKDNSIAKAFTSGFGTVIEPIVFQPSFPDKTDINLTFDRTAMSPTGISSFTNCTLRLIMEGNRIKTTENAVKIIQPLFAFGGNFGKSKLIITIAGLTLPSSLREYEFPINNENGVYINFSPTPEFQNEVIATTTGPDQASQIIDVDLIFVNLLTNNSTQQLLSYSTIF